MFTVSYCLLIILKIMPELKYIALQISSYNELATCYIVLHFAHARGYLQLITKLHEK